MKDFDKIVAEFENYTNEDPKTRAAVVFVGEDIGDAISQSVFVGGHSKIIAEILANALSDEKMRLVAGSLVNRLMRKDPSLAIALLSEEPLDRFKKRDLEAIKINGFTAEEVFWQRGNSTTARVKGGVYLIECTDGQVLIHKHKKHHEEGAATLAQLWDRGDFFESGMIATKDIKAIYDATPEQVELLKWAKNDGSVQ